MLTTTYRIETKDGWPRWVVVEVHDTNFRVPQLVSTFMADARSVLARRWGRDELSADERAALLIAADELEDVYGLTA